MTYLTIQTPTGTYKVTDKKFAEQFEQFLIQTFKLPLKAGVSRENRVKDIASLRAKELILFLSSYGDN